jgi:hypothetical protein
MTALHRFDLNELSCINKEIQVYNRKLKKMMKVMQHADIVETTVTRSDFTKHGLHLNMNGNEKLAALIKEKITSIISELHPSPVPIQWRERSI